MHLDLDFFKSLTLNLSEHLASLNLRLTVQGIQIQERSYAALIATMPEYSHFAVLQSEDTMWAFHAGARLVAVCTDRMMGGPVESAPSESQQFTFSEQFFFKLLVEWVLQFGEHKKRNFTLQRIEHFSRSLHLFFHNESVQCVTIKLKLNPNLATTLQFIFPEGTLPKSTRIKELPDD